MPQDQTDRLRTALADRYRIERELGPGGMATVYLAEDLKHKRKVAVKVLKPELAAVLGAERFVVEITTTAALQHPHILPLFDSGEADGFLYYVMPFIDGETLRSKLDRETQLSVDEAVRIASDVASALHYAHTHGVIHRDIKPENILLHDGRPMVADFGIALAVSAAAGGRMTETGLSLGTPHYMSPEQATAEKEISARSDVYSLGSVLFEMLAGQPPHLGGSAQQIIMKIITERAQDVTALRKSVPPNVAAAVAKSLEKLPADRFLSAKAFAEALATPGFTHAAVGGPAVHVGAPTDWGTRVAVPALALASLLLVVVGWGAMRPAASRPVIRYVVDWTGEAPNATSITISPDGSRLVTVRNERGRSSLYIRRRDQLESTELPGTEGAFNPSFSPSGDRVAFMSGATVRVVDIVGGPSVQLTDSLVGVPGLAWGHDGYIYYDRRGLGPLLRVKETGGMPEVVSTVDSTTKEAQHVWPEPLPNGRGVIFVINRGGPGQGAFETDGIAVLDLRTGKHRELFRGVFARYAMSGHLLYVTNKGELFGVPFDQDKLEVTGPPVALAEGVSIRSGGSGAVDLTISRDGTLWYAEGEIGSSNRELVWATREGRITPFAPEVVGDIRDAALSPDGGRLAFLLRAADGTHAYVTRIGSDTRDRLTFEKSFTEVTWHPDGRRLLLGSATGELYDLPLDGRALPDPIFRVGRTMMDSRWSTDGASLLFASPGKATVDLFTIRPGTDSAPRAIVADPGTQQSVSVSPNGRWLLYESQRINNGDVFARPFPNTSEKLRQVSTNNGRQPRWSSDGREILYRGSGDSLVAIPVLPGDEFGAPKALFAMGGVARWDVAPGSKRFLLVREADAASRKRLIVVENFHEELRTKIPR